MSEENLDPEQALKAAFAAVDDDGIARLVAAFYRRVPTDEVLVLQLYFCKTPAYS